jgi:hypothetical protein
MAGWRPGQLLLGGLVGRELPGGYVLQQNDRLLVPYYLTNPAHPDRQDQARVSIYAFPTSVAGTIAGGIVGTVVGYVIGAGLGLIREARLQGRT